MLNYCKFLFTTFILVKKDNYGPKFQGKVVHELMHALGFEHEQTRYDRDLFVRVEWQNIIVKSTNNFDKHARPTAFPKYEFDFGSLLMYGLGSFSINQEPTMVVLVRYLDFFSLFISDLIIHGYRTTPLV
jgi:Astacin (Peptidase family M12A)